jgi:hypothetical protein
LYANTEVGVFDKKAVPMKVNGSAVRRRRVICSGGWNEPLDEPDLEFAVDLKDFAADSIFGNRGSNE